jgi:hypothetical protein
VVTDADLLAALMALVEPGERGDRVSPLRWTCKSLRQVAAKRFVGMATRRFVGVSRADRNAWTHRNAGQRN